MWHNANGKPISWNIKNIYHMLKHLQASIVLNVNCYFIILLNHYFFLTTTSLITQYKLFLEYTHVFDILGAFKQYKHQKNP